MDIKVNSNYNYSYQFIKAYFKELFAKVETLQPKLTAGNNISIIDGVISTEEDLTPLHYMNYDATDEEIKTNKPIVQLVSGYSIYSIDTTNGITLDYVGVAENGNKVTIVISGSAYRGSDVPSSINLAKIVIPNRLYNNLVANSAGLVNYKAVPFYQDNITTGFDLKLGEIKETDNILNFKIYNYSLLNANKTSFFRIETTFLLGDNLVPQA